MHTEANEWAARVAARNEVETAKALHEEQLEFDWTGGGATLAMTNSGRDGARPSQGGKEMAE